MRKPMVTRSFKITKVTAMIANLTEGKTETRDIIVPGHYVNEKKLITKLHDITDNSNERFVYIISKNEDDIMYGMAEEDFIAHADILDKKTRRALDTGEAETEDNAPETEGAAETEDTAKDAEKKSKKRGK